MSGYVRQENDAEHSWHIAMMIYLLKEYANEEFDVAKAMMMALNHEVVEIYAVDTYAYDTKALETQKEREKKVADRYYKWFSDAITNFEQHLDEYYLAVNLYRSPIYPHTMRSWLKKIERANNLKEVSCHDLRHTYCSFLLSNDVPIQTVSKYMVHSDSTITLKVYSHFIPDTANRAIDAFSKLA